MPADIAGLMPGQQRYSQLLNDEGGIIDDLMVTRSASPEDDGSLMLVVNASRKDVDYAHIAARLPDDVRLQPVPERALLALQGPAAKDVLAKLSRCRRGLRFMHAGSGKVGDFDCHVSRSGYTGEDGFEISVAADKARSLRGCCWRSRACSRSASARATRCGWRRAFACTATISTRRPARSKRVSPGRSRSGGGRRAASRALSASGTSWPSGPARRRVGIKPDGRAPAREGTEILALLGDRIGVVTSGGFGPSVNGPVAMGYVQSGTRHPARR